MNENKTTNDLIDINSLLTQPRKKFFIPAYQRGYRWNEEQAVQLIDDLLEFQEEIKTQSNTSDFYCLQPLVTKIVDSNKYPEFADEGYVEVIDGQQRLTTILLLFQALHTLIKLKDVDAENKEITLYPSRYELRYETRGSSETNDEKKGWLDEIKNITEFKDSKAIELRNRNCDYFHIIEVYIAIYNKLESKDYDKLKDFRDFIKTNVKFISYEPKGNGSNNDVFDDINDGKIGLNNAELVKALLVQESNMEKKEDEAILNSIALEWDMVERRLQDKDFWGFVYSVNHPFSYETHIEYLLDLIYGKKDNDSDYEYFTFDKVNEEYRKCLCKISFAQETWGKIKKMFNSLEEWYNQRPLYHRIGYLLEYHESSSVKSLIEQLSGQKKDKQIQILDNLIRETLKDVKSIHLFHKDQKLSQVLFLYNVLAEDRRIGNTARFSFADYKSVRKDKGWDQEHIASNTDTTAQKGERIDFAQDMIEYFCGERTLFPSNESISKLSDEEKDLVERLKVIGTVAEDEFDTETLQDLFNDILSYFETSENSFRDDVEITSGNRVIRKNEKDFIWNFALLNAGTNRSYGNALYPIKRKRILNDEFNVYTPVGTRNVFEKAYSRKLVHMMSWTRDDAWAYWNEILRVLKDYIKPSNFEFPF